jgi:hypothetical protein
VLVSAARYLGVPPWELRNKPLRWIIWAHMAANSEYLAQKSMNERAGRG